ncbi:hypothetical protein [Brevibacillus brevis]|uniref:Nuclear transport factor 2 family protein n=1 Tax=Brevibacillus brevis TaxID=1393 RepID=A0ABY9T5R6_BREBE|nr:hypothetical protein [Brevibacillus brevis]WNC15442.1 hypothetical protein RGB73_03560 [Brevibacillus brevis]
MEKDKQQREGIDISSFAQEMGIKIPVFVSPVLWRTYIEPEEAISVGQTKNGRIWDMLMKLKDYIMGRVLVDSETIHFSVHFVINGNLTMVFLKATFHKDAIGKNAIFIKLPDEEIKEIAIG